MLTYCSDPQDSHRSPTKITHVLFVIIKAPAEFCSSLHTLILDGKWQNLIMSHFCHLNEWHIYHNLTGFIRHAVWVEVLVGWRSALVVFLHLMVRSQILHLFINHLLYILTEDEAYSKDCFIGISGLVFAINVLSNLSVKGTWEFQLTNGRIFRIPKAAIAWGDLFLIQFPVPTSSLVGHLAGVFAGLSYQSTFFKRYGPIQQDMEIRESD
ncbi:Rhomboid- protein 4, variant 2 [Clonorchis sinensis]|uniref:Rhomboid- protein 4, variant 2 n=1 Tax=Clonorchis sinensis TaxID=79923 RepID=A0A8T1MHG4_CLOSI|nr:Rhomboid- protein 4, variant 2 [Clonorchis sinensis]